MMKAYEDAITSEEFAHLRAEYNAADAEIVGFLLAMHRLVAEEAHPAAHPVSHLDHDYDCIATNGILSSASNMAKKGVSGIKSGLGTAGGHTLELATVAIGAFR